MNSQANLLFGVLGLMIGILLVSELISRTVLRKLSIERVLPEHGIVGQPMTVMYHFTNRKRFWPSLSVTVAELDGAEAFVKQPHAYMLHAAARMTAIVPAELIPKRRGLHRLDRHQVLTSFPFGFVKRAMIRSRPDAILIYPAIGRVDQRVIRMCQSAETSGPMIRPRRGGTDEFYGVKEYRAGENPRWIYWRRSARTGTLVSREMTQVSPPRLLLLVDTHMARRTLESHADVERVIAMAASLASEALEQGLPVGLLTWSDGWVYAPPNRGKRHRRDILTALACLRLNTQCDQRALLDESFRHLKSGTTTVLMTPRSDGVHTGASEVSRGGMVVFSADMPNVRQWFRFPETVDFTCCMPASQQVE